MYELQVVWNDKPNTIAGINKDDNIGIIRKKICIALNIDNPSDVYLYYKRKVKNDPAVVFNFVKNVFRKNYNIKYTTLQEHALQYFGSNLGNREYNMINKQQAVQLLMEVKLKVINESLCFQYISDGFIHYFAGDPFSASNASPPDMSSCLLINTFTLLLNTFDILDDTLYAVSKAPGKINSLYFPFPSAKITSNDKKLISDLSTFEKNIMDVTIPGDKAVGATNSVNYFSIKGNDLQMMNTYVDLEALFNALATSKDIPFIKYKTPLNVFYKIHKVSLTNLSKDNLDLWTKISSTKDDRSFVVLKIVFTNNSVCSIIINNDLSYVVKANVSAKEVALDILPHILPKVNKVLAIVKTVYRDFYLPDIPIDILRKSKDTDIVRVMNLITTSKLASKVIGDLDIKRLKNVVRGKMYPYFNLIDNKDPNVLHLQYKKVNNYTKFSNIGMYISMNYWLPNEELINQICMTFLISSEEADKEVSAWKASHAVELEMDKGSNRGFYIKPKGDNFVNIKMRLGNSIDMKYIVTGITNTAVMKDIDDLVLRMMLLSEKEKVADKSAEKEAKKKITQLEKLETKVNEKDNVQEAMIDMLSFDDHDINGDRYSPLVQSDMGDDDEDMKALLLGFEEDLNKLETTVKKDGSAKKNNTNSKGEVDKKVELDKKPGKKLKGYFLDKLYQADKNLFEYPVPPNQNDYASVCGWVDKRQPVVVSSEELDKISKEFPNSINGHVKTGSTHEHYKKNFYICPKIWCPKSRVALSYDDYVKFGRKCPYPEIKEEPELFASKSYFGEGDAGLQKERYPKFLNKNMHPEKFCLPCCYKIKPSNKPLKDKDMCILNNQDSLNTNKNIKKNSARNVTEDDELEEDHVENKERYIKGADYVPVDNNRFGLLPPMLVEFFGQIEKQGSRHDGSGGMSDKTDAIFRRGVLQTRQSYLDALVVILDNPSVRTTGQLVQLINDKIDVLTYISLENGRIMKMFVDTTKTIYNKDSFRTFYEWFKNQKKYILQMNLDRLLVEIEKADRVFDKESLLHQADILREYIIYTSFMNFKEYLLNDRIPKDHMVLIDYVSRSKDININKYNIIHLEYVHSETAPKVYAHCSVNRNVALDYNYPFAFLLKRDAYYEPLSHVTLKNGSVMTDMHIEYSKTKNIVLKKLVDFVKNNCNKSATSQDLAHFIDFLKGTGYKPKYYVIDYGYKTCGLILNHNIYVPLEVRDDLYYVNNIKYVYISDVTNFKCFLEQDTIKDIFNKIYAFTKSKFYKPKEFLEDGKWLVLQGGAHIPLKVSGDQNTYTFKEGMFIFIGNEKDDRRKEIYSKFEKESQYIQGMALRMKDIMLKNEKVNSEVKFLLDENNPLPLVYKKERLAGILKADIKADSVPDKLVYKLLNYMNEGSKHYKLYMARTRRFTWEDGEVLFDHYDILNGKLRDAVKFAENPQRAFLEVIEEINDEYIFEERVEVDFKDIILKDKLLEPPVKWRKLLKGYKVIDNDDAYHQNYMFDVFQKIAANNGAKSFNRDIYNLLVKRRTIEGYEKGNTLEILDNPYMQSYFKKQRLVATMDLVLTQQESIYYYPSTFDIKIMANLARVSIVLIGRKTMKNPDGLEVIYNGSDVYTIISYSYDRFKVIDKFAFFTFASKITYTSQELPGDFKDILAKKMIVYNVEV